MTLLAKVNPKRRRPAFPVFFDGLFNDFLNTSFPEILKDEFVAHRPAVNVKEIENGFLLDLAVPGLKKEDIDIKIEEEVLTISGKTKSEEKVNEEKYSRQEFNYASFSRSFTLNDSIDVDNIKANHENGILSITLPKKEEVKPESRVIEIA